MYCLNLLRIALELAVHNHVYEDIATKFFEHFLAIAGAINGVGDDALGLWDETDQFYYDHLSLPDGRTSAAEGAIHGRPDSAVCRPSRSSRLRSSSCPNSPHAWNGI